MANLTVDQPMPGDALIPEGRPCCLELTAPSGQAIARLVFLEVPIEDIVLTVIPAFRQQSGIRGPLGFFVRALTEAEQKALAVAQE